VKNERLHLMEKIKLLEGLKKTLFLGPVIVSVNNVMVGCSNK
jgi:hypothetical protein